MAAHVRDPKQIQIYSWVLALCAFALLFGLWNGLQRGHWQNFGLFAVLVIGLNIALLLHKELRKPSEQEPPQKLTHDFIL